MSITRASNSPVIARQVCSDGGEEVKSSRWCEEKHGTTLGAGIHVMKLRQGASSLMQVPREEARPQILTAFLQV